MPGASGSFRRTQRTWAGQDVAAEGRQAFRRHPHTPTALRLGERMQLAEIIDRLLARLVADGQLELVEAASITALADEVLVAMRDRRGPAQFGSLVSGVLVGSELVEELYADDATIARLLSDL